MRLLLITCAAVSLACCQKASQPAENEAATATAELPGKGVDRSHNGTAAPKIGFNDPDGNATSLAAFVGRPTLVNLWASWCAPCVKELPTLDKLARAEAGRINVVAISQDDAPHASVEAFLQTHKIATLDSYQDPKMRLAGALGAEVMPTSVLYDANGREIWRYIGDQDWTSREAATLVGESSASKGS